MSQAVTCPVCGGSGQYMPAADPNVTAARCLQPCHGCDGKGWVEVGPEYSPPPYMPSVPCPNPYPCHPAPWPAPYYIGDAPPFTGTTWGADYATNGSLYGVGLNTSSPECHQA